MLVKLELRPTFTSQSANDSDFEAIFGHLFDDLLKTNRSHQTSEARPEDTTESDFKRAKRIIADVQKYASYDLKSRLSDTIMESITCYDHMAAKSKGKSLKMSFTETGHLKSYVYESRYPIGTKVVFAINETSGDDPKFIHRRGHITEVIFAISGKVLYSIQYEDTGECVRGIDSLYIKAQHEHTSDRDLISDAMRRQFIREIEEYLGAKHCSANLIFDSAYADFQTVLKSHAISIDLANLVPVEVVALFTGILTRRVNSIKNNKADH